MITAKRKASFTEGPIFWKMTAFAIPIMLTGLLQIVYSMADNIVVGRFSGDPYALGAVGSTSSLNNLIINLMLGTSAGTGIAVAQSYGAKQENMVSRTVHTAMTFSVIGGIAFMILGLLISRPALVLMNTRAEFLDNATLYLRIICLGIPASAIYNFGNAILRSIGNSKLPLFILGASGLVNVGLNVLFVAAFHMSVAGVALATIISQYISAAAVLTVLIKNKNECYGLNRKKYTFDGKILARILRLGIPAGLQSSMFSLSNMLLVSSINTLSDISVTAFTIANNIDAITYTCGNAFSQAVMTFTGQNYGARKPERMKKSLFYGLIQSAVAVFTVGQIELFFGEQITGLYISAQTANRELVITEVMSLISLLLTVYFICGVMEAFAGFLRGLGYALIPMISSLIGVCGVRILWIMFAFPNEKFHSLRGIMTCYPVSWSVTMAFHISVCIFAWIKLKKSKIGLSK